MPGKPLRPCPHPGCARLTTGGRCELHQRVADPQRRHDEERKSSSARGYDRRWRAAREQYLRAHPLCECDECKAGELQVTIATVVDHKVPHRGDPTLFWDQKNWQAMSKEHHDKKTSRERREHPGERAG